MSEISKLDRNYVIKKIDSQTSNVQILDNSILIAIVGEFNYSQRKK